jgi:HSP20 family protein
MAKAKKDKAKKARKRADQARKRRGTGELAREWPFGAALRAGWDEPWLPARAVAGWLEELWREMEELRARAAGREGGGAFLPPFEVRESDAQYTLALELPGCRREDLQVEVGDGRVTIRGEKRSEREDEGERSRRVERSYGSFARSFALPADADAERLEAAFREGVLELAIPRTGERKVQPVAIKAG